MIFTPRVRSFIGSKKAILPALFLFSLLFHSIVYYTLFAKNEPFVKYPEFARQYVTAAIDNERLMDFSPLYLFVHIVAQKYFSHPAAVVLWLQFAATACAAVLFFLLLKLFFNAVISLLGTLVFITSRSIVLYANVFEPEVLLIFLILGFLVCALRKSYAMALLAGLFLGLTLCIRMNLFPLVFITPLFFRLNRERGKIFLCRTVLFCVPVCAAIVFLMVRNAAITGAYSPVVMNPGDVFYEGNNPDANGWNAVYPPMIDNAADDFQNEVDAPHLLYRLFPRRITGKQLPIAEVNAWWAGKAKNFIADHPWYWCRQVCRKVHCVFHTVRWHDIGTVMKNDRDLQKSPVAAIPFGLISAMALIGMLLSIRAWRERLLFYGVVVCQISVMALTYASDRQRISILALFIFFAAALLQAVGDNKTAARRRLMLIAATAALLPFFFLQSERQRDGLYLRQRIQTAQAAVSDARNDRDQWRLKSAAEKNVMAYALAPYLAESQMSGLRFAGQSFQERAIAVAESFSTGATGCSQQLDLAVLYCANGKLAQAEKLLQEVICGKHVFSRISAQSSQSRYYLAQVYERQGRRPEAVASLQKALAENPGDPWVLSCLAVLTGNSAYNKKISRYFDEIDAAFFMGKAWLADGRCEEAVRSFSYVAEKLPEYEVGRAYLSIALGALGDFNRAAQVYIRVMQGKGEPLFGEKEILDIFYKWVRQSPGNTEAEYYCGTVLKSFGHYDEALDIFTRLLRKNPSMAMAKTHIAWLENARKSSGME